MRASMKVAISLSSSATERCTPGCNCLRVTSANQPSTWLIQDAEVGVQWMCQCGRRASQALIFMVLLGGGVVAHDDMHFRPLRHPAINLFEKVEEPACPVTLVALSDLRRCPTLMLGRTAIPALHTNCPIHKTRGAARVAPGPTLGFAISRPRTAR